jgi:hypothetical protein
MKALAARGTRDAAQGFAAAMDGGCHKPILTISVRMGKSKF